MTTLSTAQVAEKLSTDAKTLRKFLRSDSCKIASVGKGKRYEIDAKSVQAMRSQFTKWNAAADEKPAAPKPARVRSQKADAPVEDPTHTEKEVTGGVATS